MRNGEHPLPLLMIKSTGSGKSSRASARHLPACETAPAKTQGLLVLKDATACQMMNYARTNFNIIGVTETTITNGVVCLPNIPGYISEHVPTPLASGGAGRIDEAIYYAVLEKKIKWIFSSILDRNTYVFLERNM